MLNIFDKIDAQQKSKTQKRNKSQQVYSHTLAFYLNEYLFFAEKQRDSSVYDYISASFDSIGKLVKMGANVNSPYSANKSVSTFLGFAMKYKHFEFIELLLKNGANLEQVFFMEDSNNTISPIEYANTHFSESEKQKFFEICEKCGYKINENKATAEQNNNSETLLLMIANCTEKEIIDYIKTHDINPDFCKNKKPILQILIENKKIDAMFALLDKGADINKPFLDNDHAIVHIYTQGLFSRQIFDKLLEYGLDVNYQNKLFGTPLIAKAVIACNGISQQPSQQAKEFFMALLENGANLHTLDYKNDDIWRKLLYCPDFFQQQVEMVFPKQTSFSVVSNQNYESYEQFETVFETQYDTLDKSSEKAKYFVIHACENFVPKAIIHKNYTNTIGKILKHPYAMPDVVLYHMSFYHEFDLDKLNFVLSYNPAPNSVFMQKTLQLCLAKRNFDCAEKLIAYGTKFDSYYLSPEFCRLHDISENTYLLIKDFAQKITDKKEKIHNPQTEINDIFDKALSNVDKKTDECDNIEM